MGHEQTPDIQPDVQDAARRTSYDDVPYVSQPLPQTHPDRLATLERLFGLAPAPITRCRVLKLGCASGGNLIPLAYQLPESEFVGVDLSRRQIARGRTVVQFRSCNLYSHLKLFL